MIYNHLKKLKIFFLLHIGIIGLAQFNTITSFNAKKENQRTEEEIEQRIFLGKEKVPMQEEEKEEKKKTGFFRSKTTKADLKKEIDALKELIKEKNKHVDAPKKETKEFDYKKIEDSLIQMMQGKIGQRVAPKKMKAYDLIEDYTNYDYHSRDSYIGQLHMPLKNIIITSYFGSRIHPIFGGRKMHNGVDFRANYENVYAVLDGEVVESGWDSKGGGNYIKIRHSDRFETSYLHLSQVYYKKGEKVRGGYIIAKSGNSGNSTAPHLHFAVKEYGQFINPIPFLNSLIKANNLIALYNGK